MIIVRVSSGKILDWNFKTRFRHELQISRLIKVSCHVIRNFEWAKSAEQSFQVCPPIDRLWFVLTNTEIL